MSESPQSFNAGKGVHQMKSTKSLVLSLVAGAAAVIGGLAISSSPSQQAVAQATASAATTSEAMKIDAVHSSVLFRIKHLNVAWFYGMFEQMSGSFLIDMANPDKSMVDITIDASSVDTNNSGRDDHVRSQQFFSVKEFPTITFKSNSVKKTGDKTLEMTGELSFRGKTKTITATVEDTGSGPGRKGGTVAGLEAKFMFKRSDFGMTYLLENGGLSDEVFVIVALEGAKN
jgi:polyisoprenoid-binding protein YceI